MTLIASAKKPQLGLIIRAGCGPQRRIAMVTRYEARVFVGHKYRVLEFESEQEARAQVEAWAREYRASGEVIHWAVHHNLPGALPKEVYRSCALWTYTEKEGWKQINIHG